MLKTCACGCGGVPRIAERTNRSKGWLKGRQLKFMPNHNNHGPKLATPTQREKWVKRNAAGKSKTEIWDGLVAAKLLSGMTQFEDIGFSRLMRTLDRAAV